MAHESGAAGDCRRDAGAGSLGLESGTTARRECQPGIPLAEAYQEGRLGTTTNFLPVRVASEQRGEEVNASGFIPQPGTMEIKLPKGTLRVFGIVDVMTLRTVIECLV